MVCLNITLNKADQYVNFESEYFFGVGELLIDFHLLGPIAQPQIRAKGC